MYVSKFIECMNILILLTTTKKKQNCLVFLVKVKKPEYKIRTKKDNSSVCSVYIHVYKDMTFYIVHQGQLVKSSVDLVMNCNVTFLF